MFKLPTFGPGQIPVQHQPERRLKRIYLSVQSGQIVVRTPLHIRQRDIMHLLDKHQHWLQQRLETQVRPQQNRQLVYYLGKSYPLQYCEPTPEHFAEAVLQTDVLQLYLAASLRQEEQIQCLLKRFLEQQARSIMHQRLLHWSARMQLSPAKVRYKWLKSRWGSCSARQNINLNIRAIQLPLNCVDAILVHELAHLVHLNHGPDFWALVHTYLPDYPQCQVLMKQFSSQLL